MYKMSLSKVFIIYIVGRKKKKKKNIGMVSPFVFVESPPPSPPRFCRVLYDTKKDSANISIYSLLSFSFLSNESGEMGEGGGFSEVRNQHKSTRCRSDRDNCI